MRTKATTPTPAALAVGPKKPKLSITNLDEYAHMALETCRIVVDRATCCNSPVEDLIHDLLFAYRAGRVSHKHVTAILDQYRDNVEALQRDIRAYLAQNDGEIA